MSNSNQFLPFATGAGANVMDPVAWDSATERLTGFQAGTASSEKVNTALRQSMFVAAMIAQFTADYGPSNVVDNGNLATLENQFVAALAASLLGDFANIYEGSDVGTANAMEVDTFTPALSVMNSGKVLLITKSAAANTGNLTLTAGGVGPAAVIWPDGNQLAAGSWPASSQALLFYTGSVFHVLSFPGPSLIQSLVGLYHGDDTGAANSLVITPTPALPAYAAYKIIVAKIAVTNTGPSVANISGLGTIPVTRSDGSALKAGDLLAGSYTTFICTGTSLQLASFGHAEVPRLLSSPTVWVRTDGDDSHDGSANTGGSGGKAKATIAGAVSMINTDFLTIGQTITVQLGNAGIYAMPNVVTAQGTLIIQGDPAHPDAYILTSTTGGSLGGLMDTGGGGNIIVNGVTMQNASTNYGTVFAGVGFVILENTIFTTSAVNIVGHLTANGGSIGIGDGCSFAGSGSYLGLATSGGNITFGDGSSTITILGGPTYSTATVIATSNGSISDDGATFSGSASGPRYLAKLCGTIETFGAGESFFPGSSAGSKVTGGQYE